jgi:rare lipoprotein A
MLLRFGSLGRCICLALTLLSAACAETEVATRVDTADSATTAGHYKVGNPYQVAGIWYYPKVDYDYREKGIASWYGPGFHGKRTANGEIYDQEQMTAAHPTLPLPSMVRVTNLENGRSVTLRINDRGPFKNGRIIDVSRRGAELLGFLGPGTARVRVEIMESESRRLATVARRGEAAQAAPSAAPLVPVVAADLDKTSSNGNGVDLAALDESEAREPLRPAVVEPEPDGKVTQQPVYQTRIFVQAGAFIRRDNAVRLGVELSAYGPTAVTEAMIGDRTFYRVRLGPVDSVESADQILMALVRDGHTSARVVVD